jgi:pre-rRNA-processing protein IPI3
MSSKYEVVYCVSNGDGMDVFDLRSGAHLKAYQSTAACRGNIPQVDDRRVFLSTGQKPGVVVLDWFTGAVQTKCGASERMGPVAVTPDGLYCAAGSQSGKVFVWSVLNGALLSVFPAHYKALTCLQFSADGAFLVSASEDAVVRVWLLGDVLSSGKSDPEPYCTWSEHTLAVTDLCLSGVGFQGKVWSCSLDQSVKVWDISAKQLVYSFEFDSALRSVRVDPAETFFVCAGADGRVRKTNLLRVHGSQLPDSEAFQPLEGKLGDPLSALSLNLDASLLVGATLRGKVGVWDVQTLQLLHVLEKGRSSYHAVKVLHHAEGLVAQGMEPKERLRPVCDKFTKHSASETLTPVPYAPAPSYPWRVFTSEPYSASTLGWAQPHAMSNKGQEQKQTQEESSSQAREQMNQGLMELTSMLLDK